MRRGLRVQAVLQKDQRLVAPFIFKGKAMSAMEEEGKEPRLPRRFRAGGEGRGAPEGRGSAGSGVNRQAVFFLGTLGVGGQMAEHFS